MYFVESVLCCGVHVELVCLSVGFSQRFFPQLDFSSGFFPGVCGPHPPKFISRPPAHVSILLLCDVGGV